MGEFCQSSVNPEWIRIRVDGRIRYEYAVITKRVDADIFVSGKKKLRIQKYPDTCRRGLSRRNPVCLFVCLFSFLDKQNYHPSIKLATTLHVVSGDCFHLLQSASRFTRDEWCKNNLDGKSNGNTKKATPLPKLIPQSTQHGDRVRIQVRISKRRWQKIEGNKWTR